MIITAEVKVGDVLVVVTDPEGTDFVSHMHLDPAAKMTFAAIVEEGLKGIQWCKKEEMQNDGPKG